MSKTKQSFEYTGSDQYTIDNTILSSSGIALFDSATGVGGVDYIPYDGALVKVKAGDIYGDYRQLAPTLNNKLYYLVSDVEYTSEQKSLILSLATEISVYFNGTEFEGDFVFSNPNNYPYIYLLWDYEDKMDSVSSYRGSTDSRYIGLEYGNKIGIAGISYSSMDPDQPTRFQIEWNGSIVRDSLYVGLNSIHNYNALIDAGVPENEIGLVYPYDGTINNGIGTLEFFKSTIDSTANLIVSSPFSNSTWIVNKIETHLKKFYIDTTDGLPGDNVCSQCPTTLMYHNGLYDLPTVNDIIFTVNTGYERYSSVGFQHMIDTVECFSPDPTNKTYIEVDENGVVLSVSPCNCAEYAVPFIYEGTITTTSGSQSYEVINVINNPTSWKLVSNNFLPGISFADGVVSFNNAPTGTYRFTINASNCLGQSADSIINIVVLSNSDAQPCLIDVEQFKEVSSDACGVIPTLTMVYFTGVGAVPNIKDTIYYDSSALKPFMGGEKWYYLNDSDYVIQIAQDGTVMDIYNCPGVTTTTTSTTTTTLPSGYYFIGQSCQDTTKEVLLLDSSMIYSLGDIVKTIEGNCWELTSITFAQPGYFLIDSGTYGDCSSCTGTTTTSTTTTTTTSPTYTYFELDTSIHKTALDACGSSYVFDTFFFSGSTSDPNVNDFVYYDSLGTTLFDGEFHWHVYKVPSSGSISCMLIANTGQILDIYDCSTTTTTTTTTSIPTYYYRANVCGSGDVKILDFMSFDPLPLGTVVKDSDGICSTLYMVESPGGSEAHILYSYESCFECLSSIPTTTTTTTTSTTTTSTTTTTTTTRPLLTSLILSSNANMANVCTVLNIETFYVNGMLGVPGNSIFVDALGSDPAPAGWYLQIITNIAYEWDGADWTGSSISC